MGGNHTTMRMLLDDVKEEEYQGIDELWEILWNRDPTENPIYSLSIPASSEEGNSSDRGYLLHTFLSGSISGYINPDPVMPIHIDDVSREYYKENTWLISNTGLTNNVAAILSGTKLKEETGLEPGYVRLTDYIPLMMNSYSMVDLILIDPTINSYGVRVPSINNNPTSSTPLMFLTPRKILNGLVNSVYNETQGFYYDLTGMDIINNQVIDLDFGLNPLGLNIGDSVRVDYVAVDYTNEYDHLISVHNPSSFILFSTIEVSLVYKIFNYTKGFEYDLGGSSYLEANKLIHLDPLAGNNTSIGLDQGDIIFATYITINDSENPAPVLTQSNGNFITTAIELFPV
jgi:hypothetical protein